MEGTNRHFVFIIGVHECTKSALSHREKIYYFWCSRQQRVVLYDIILLLLLAFFLLLSAELS